MSNINWTPVASHPIPENQSLLVIVDVYGEQCPAIARWISGIWYERQLSSGRFTLVTMDYEVTHWTFLSWSE